jgi:hypothetical protein
MVAIEQASIAKKCGSSFRDSGPRRAGRPMTAREITDALIADKAPKATHKQVTDLREAILAALRKRNGGAVVGKGAPARWGVHSQEATFPFSQTDS